MNAIQDLFRFAKYAYTGEGYFDAIKTTVIGKGSDICYVIEQENRIVIAFRGSDDRADWISNFKCLPLAQNKTIELGFYEGWVQFKNDISVLIFGSEAKAIYCTGHSRGAALATLCARHIAKNMGLVCSCINYGSPMVFSKQGRDEYNILRINTTRVVNGYDIVTSVPLYEMGYRHVGNLYHCAQPFWHRWFHRFRDHSPSEYEKAINKEATN